MAASLKNRTNSEQYVLRITPDLDQRIRAQAQREERPLMWVMRKAIEQYLAREDRKRTNGRKR